jgi:ArsR family transcriptional regulator, cadmium/lead-responsive transcriptional repressor
MGDRSRGCDSTASAVLSGTVLKATVDLDALGRIGTALADDTRRRLLVELLDGPRYPSDLVDALDLTKANVSNHLACLRGCGLVVAEPEGRRVRYELADERFATALRQLTELALPPADGCAHGSRARR